MEEQAVPLQPMVTTRSRSPCVAMEERMGQQWMGPEGAHSPWILLPGAAQAGAATH